MSRLIRVKQAVSLGHTLFAFLFLIYNYHLLGSNGCVQMQRWKRLFLKHRVERVKLCNEHRCTVKQNLDGSEAGVGQGWAGLGGYQSS